MSFDKWYKENQKDIVRWMGKQQMCRIAYEAGRKDPRPSGSIEGVVSTQKEWDWGYARWLVRLRKALKSTGYFENGVYPSPSAWKPLYDEGKTPAQAVSIDMPFAIVSGLYMTF